MKSRIVILTMLVFGMLLSTAGAGLAVSGLAGQNDASTAQYGEETPAGGGDVLGDQDEGTNVAPEETAAAGMSSRHARSRPAPTPTRRSRSRASRRSRC